MFKAITLDSKASVISPADPAIDHDASDMDKYAEIAPKDPGAWREYIKPLAGEKLCIFHFGVIDPAEFTRIEADTGMGMRQIESRRPDEMYYQCFLAGMRDIENPPVDDSKEIPTVSRNGVPFIDPNWLRKVFSRGLRQVAVAIGQTIYIYNQTTEDDAKK